MWRKISRKFTEHVCSLFDEHLHIQCTNTNKKYDCNRGISLVFLASNYIIMRQLLNRFELSATGLWSYTCYTSSGCNRNSKVSKNSKFIPCTWHASGQLKAKESEKAKFSFDTRSTSHTHKKNNNPKRLVMNLQYCNCHYCIYSLFFFSRKRINSARHFGRRKINTKTSAPKSVNNLIYATCIVWKI